MNMQIYTVITLPSLTFAAFITDSRSGLIPNRLCGAGLVLAFCARAAEHRQLLPADLCGAAMLLCVLLTAYRFHRIGGGDVKLLTVLSLLLPFRELLQFVWLTMLFAAAAGIILFIDTKDRYVRLGPAMFLASLVTAGLGGFA